MSTMRSTPTPSRTAWRTSRVWRSGGPPDACDRVAGRRGRAGRDTLVGSSPSSKNDKRSLLAQIEGGQYDHRARPVARCKFAVTDPLPSEGRQDGRPLMANGGDG